MQVIDLLINRLESSRGWTCGLLEDIEASDWFFQPAPGVQHVAWQVGHLASSQVTLVHARCFGKTPTDHIPARFKVLFGKGSSPDDDPSLYPAPTEIRRVFDAVHSEVLELVRSISPDELDRPTAGDPHPMFTNKGQCIAMVSLHESFHAGQIALTRRILGKAPLR